jgi:hypothetical protein
MKTIKIIVDEEIPSIHLLNSTEWDVVETKQDDVFAMTRKEKVEVPPLSS